MAKGTVHIDREVCKGCGLCVSVCPRHGLAMDDRAINCKGYQPAELIKEDECIACQICAVMCPDQAITVEKFDDQKGAGR